MLVQKGEPGSNVASARLSDERIKSVAIGSVAAPNIAFKENPDARGEVVRHTGPALGVNEASYHLAGRQL